MVCFRGPAFGDQTDSQVAIRANGDVFGFEGGRGGDIVNSHAYGPKFANVVGTMAQRKEEEFGGGVGGNNVGPGPSRAWVRPGGPVGVDSDVGFGDARDAV